MDEQSIYGDIRSSRGDEAVKSFGDRMQNESGQFVISGGEPHADWRAAVRRRLG